MSDELWIIRSKLTRNIIGCAHSRDTAKAMAEHPRSKVTKGYTLERFVKADSASRPKGNVCPASVDDGILTLHNGEQADLLKIQAACNFAFQELGDPDFSEAADEMSKITGLVQGPHGEWELK
jgi:hypothetical protein